MANTVSSIGSTPVVGLGTQTFPVPADGLYTVEVKYWLPYRAAGTSYDSASTEGQSELQVLVKLNGSTKLTIGGQDTDPTPTQPYIAGAVQIAASAGDSITIVPSSSAAVDNQLNAVKGIINIFAGPGA